jgi:orotate phosphoribosyltransferase
MSFSQQEFQRFLIKNKVVGFSDPPILLKSKKESYWYANFRKLSQDYFLLEKLAAMVADFLLDFPLDKIDAILGVPEGASLLGYEVQRQLVKKKKIKDKIFHFRMIPKKHGAPSDRYWVNGNFPKKLILLEDVSTTGISMVNFFQKLQKMDIEVPLVVGLLTREQLNDKGESLPQILDKLAINYRFLTRAQEILPLALQQEQRRVFFAKKIKKEYQKEYQLFQKDSILCSLTPM